MNKPHKLEFIKDGIVIDKQLQGMKVNVAVVMGTQVIQANTCLMYRDDKQKEVTFYLQLDFKDLETLRIGGGL